MWVDIIYSEYSSSPFPPACTATAWPLIRICNGFFKKFQKLGACKYAGIYCLFSTERRSCWREEGFGGGGVTHTRPTPPVVLRLALYMKGPLYTTWRRRRPSPTHTHTHTPLYIKLPLYTKNPLYAI